MLLKNETSKHLRTALLNVVPSQMPQIFFHLFTFTIMNRTTLLLFLALMLSQWTLQAQKHQISLTGNFAHFNVFPQLKEFNLTGLGFGLTYEYQFNAHWSAGLAANVHLLNNNDVEFTDEVGNPFTINYRLGTLKPMLKYALLNRAKHKLSVGVSSGWNMFSTKIKGLPVEDGFAGFDDEYGGNAGFLLAYQHHLKNGWSLVAQSNLEWVWVNRLDDEAKRLFTANLGVAKSF